MGQLDHGIHLVEDVADVAQVQPAQTERLAIVTQTTLSVDDAAEIMAAVKARFPEIRQPKQQDICYATQNRQDAVKMMSREVDVVIVVGSPTSSNSNRLAELARKLGVPSYMVDSPGELKAEWLDGKARVGLTAGASAPEVLVQEGDRPHQGAGRGVGAQDGRRRRDGEVPHAQGPEALNRARRRSGGGAPRRGRPRLRAPHAPVEAARRRAGRRLRRGLAQAGTAAGGRQLQGARHVQPPAGQPCSRQRRDRRLGRQCRHRDRGRGARAWREVRGVRAHRQQPRQAGQAARTGRRGGGHRQRVRRGAGSLPAAPEARPAPC